VAEVGRTLDGDGRMLEGAARTLDGEGRMLERAARTLDGDGRMLEGAARTLDGDSRTLDEAGAAGCVAGCVAGWGASGAGGCVAWEVAGPVGTVGTVEEPGEAGPVGTVEEPGEAGAGGSALPVVPVPVVPPVVALAVDVTTGVDPVLDAHAGAAPRTAGPTIVAATGTSLRADTAGRGSLRRMRADALFDIVRLPRQ
jgi:hypothetical protein